MNVYKYNDNGEYIGTEEALLDPLETEQQEKEVYLLPANATFTEPLEAQEGYVNVWNGEAWEQVEDNRGIEYWLPEDKFGAPAREMKELGALPEGATLTPPEQTLEELKTTKIADMKAERDIKEVEPIEYNGNFFDYDDKARDRINAAIIALEQLGEEASLAWTTADNTEVMVTAQDLKNVISAVAVRSNNLHIAYRDAKEAVKTVENEEALEAIKLEDYIPSLEVLTEQ